MASARTTNNSKPRPTSAYFLGKGHKAGSGSYGSITVATPEDIPDLPEPPSPNESIGSRFVINFSKSWGGTRCIVSGLVDPHSGHSMMHRTSTYAFSAGHPPSSFKFMFMPLINSAVDLVCPRHPPPTAPAQGAPATLGQLRSGRTQADVHLSALG